MATLEMESNAPTSEPQSAHSARESAPGSTQAFDVTMLATVHSATDDRVFHREAKTLAQAGMAVCIIAPRAASEWIDGVWIEALRKPSNRLGRFLQSFKVMRMALRLKCGVFIFHDSELFPAGILLRLFGRKVIYDCHENLPVQVLQKPWLPRPLRPIVSPLAWFMEWGGSRLLSGVLVARDAVLPRFPRKRRLSIRNFPTLRTLKATDGPPIHLRKPIAIYSGGLSRPRGIPEIIEVFRGLQVPHAELWLVGAFENEQFKQETLASLPPNVKWLGFMDHHQAVKFYASARVGISLLHPTPSHRNSQPVKIYEYLGAGLPVLSSEFPELSELLEGCGVQVDPFNIPKIREVLGALLLDDEKLTEMSRIGRERIANSYSWEKEGERLVEFCSKLAGSKQAHKSNQ